MSFVHPLLALAGLLCVSIPIVIHFLLRRRRTPVVFGAMRFVIEAYRQQRSRLRLEHLLLLALRCLMIALVSIAIARPLFRADSGIGVSVDRWVYVLLDTGVSTSARLDESQTVFDALRGSIDALLASLSDTDKAGLVLFGTPSRDVVLPPTSDIGALRELIGEAQPTDAGTDLSAGLQLVLDDIGSQASSRQGESLIVIATSQFDGSLELSDPFPSQITGMDRVQVLLVGPDSGSIPNTQITEVKPLRSILLLGEDQLLGSGQATVTLRRTGGAERDDAVSTVRVWMEREGRAGAASSTTVRWQPGQQEALAVVPLASLDSVREYTDTVLVAQIDRDALDADNTRRVPLPTRQVLSVGVLSRRRFGGSGSLADLGSDEWIRRALVPSDRSPLDLRIVDPSTLDASALSGLDAVVLLRPDLVDAGGWARLRRYVDRGGLMILSPPDQVQVHLWADDWLDAFGLDAQLAREATEIESQSLAPGRFSGHHLTLLEGEIAVLLRPVQVHKAVLFERLPESIEPVISFSDGTPWFVRIPLDAEGENREAATSFGSVLYLASALHLDWTNLPAMPLMVPLMQESIRQGVAAGRAAQMILAGQVPEATGRAARFVPTTSSGSASFAARDDENIGRSGVYRMEDDLQNEVGIVVVNTDVDGARTTHLAQGDVLEWVYRSGLAPEQASWFGGQGETEGSGPLEAGAEQSDDWLSAMLLLAGLVFALIEVVLARYFSHAFVSQTTTHIPEHEIAA